VQGHENPDPIPIRFHSFSSVASAVSSEPLRAGAGHTVAIGLSAQSIESWTGEREIFAVGMAADEG
jgi:hypothetical protein